MQSRFTPFEKDLTAVLPEDLSVLRDVHEGWYVEYKSELSQPRDIAKSISSFANQLGGWIFYGIHEDNQMHVADTFPGIPNSEVPSALESIRNASKDLISPDVFYNTKVFEGPIDSVGLTSGRSVVMVQVPQGADCPYLHNNGRIYRRVADSSDPKPETDRARLDLLVERGVQAQSRLENRITRQPSISKNEKDNCYVHISILSDPYETMGHQYTMGFSAFGDTMSQGMLPFDNIYTNSGGYVARQTLNNKPYYRVFTWEFSKRCHSFITCPITIFKTDLPDSDLPGNSIYHGFVSILEGSGLQYSRVLDLNQVFVIITGIIARHRRLAQQANVRGPFYVKAYLENIWRTVPFLDLPVYLENVLKTTDYLSFKLTTC